MSTWQIVLAILEAVGTAMTLGGLIALFVGARNRYRQARAQLVRAIELGTEEEAEHAHNPDNFQAIYEKYVALHEQNGVPRPAGYGGSYQPGYESVNIMRALGNGALRDLIVASTGVMASGAAGVLANLFPIS